MKEFKTDVGKMTYVYKPLVLWGH